MPSPGRHKVKESPSGVCDLRTLGSSVGHLSSELTEMAYKCQELARLSLTFDTGPPPGQGVSAGACVSQLLAGWFEETPWPRKGGGHLICSSQFQRVRV